MRLDLPAGQQSKISASVEENEGVGRAQSFAKHFLGQWPLLSSE